ncbi:MAG: DNA polymerase III subunit delta [Stappiaceae bacterium]
MVALKPAEIDRFLKQPHPDCLLVLIYGPDIGLVSERARALINQATSGNDDPFSQVKLSASDLTGDPDRLIDEILTIPMFGGRRTIWIKDGSNAIAGAIKGALEVKGGDALVVVEAGDLKRGSALRKQIEQHKTATAVPCYADAERDIDRLIDEETRSSNLAISREARAALHSLLGADRMASRGELKKLCLYTQGQERIETDDVEKVVGDASALAVDALIDASALGDLAKLDHAIERFHASGMNGAVLAGMILRHFQWLDRARAEHDAGKGADQVVAGALPPIYFKRRPAVARQIALWSPTQLAKATALLNDCILQTRLMPDHLGHAIISDALLTLARVAAQNNKRRRR